MKNPILLVKATEKDVSRIRELAFETWFTTYRSILSQEQMEFMFEWMYSENALREQLLEKRHTFFLACENEVALGYVSVEKQGSNLFHLHKIYVTPAAQGKGIGKILLEKAFEYSKEQAEGEPCTVELNVNRYNKALNFYERMGMHIHDQGDFDIGNGYFMNDYILRIDL